MGNRSSTAATAAPLSPKNRERERDETMAHQRAARHQRGREIDRQGESSFIDGRPGGNGEI